MAEVLLEFRDVVAAEGVRYHAHACGAATADGSWQGWLEFIPMGAGEPIRSRRETTQSNRTDIEYWATGLTPVYLEGALQRALNPPATRRVIAADRPIFDGPAPSGQTVVMSDAPDAVLDPFAVYDHEGEELLRRQLAALAAWHLVNIVIKYELSDQPRASLSRLPSRALIEQIVVGVRAQTGIRRA